MAAVCYTMTPKPQTPNPRTVLDACRQYLAVLNGTVIMWRVIL